MGMQQDDHNIPKKTETRSESITPQDAWTALGLPGKVIPPHPLYPTIACNDAEAIKEELSIYARHVEEYTASLSHSPSYERFRSRIGIPLDPVPFNDSEPAPPVQLALVAWYVGGIIDDERLEAEVYQNLAFRSWSAAEQLISRIEYYFGAQAEPYLDVYLELRRAIEEDEEYL